MKFGIIGGSGFIGSAVREELTAKGHRWVGFSRTPEGRAGEWRSLEEGVAGLDGLVNCSGESVAKRWTAASRQEFHRSRVGVTGQIVKEIAKLPEAERPRVLVNASGVGYYGDAGDAVLDEKSSAGEGYLAQLCEDWEGAATAAEELGVRVVFARIGVVLGREGDAWKKMKLAFQMGGGGRLGSGEQYWPWVHLQDVAGGIVHLLEKEEIRGAVNLTGPEETKNSEFTRLLGKALARPTLIPVPAFALKLLLGGFAEALLASHRVKPAVLLSSGYQFRFATLEKVFEDLK